LIVALGVLAVFLLCAVLMYRRIMPAIVAVPVMAVAMALVAGVPLLQIGGIVTGGAVALAPVYVTVIFGALLARVTLDTGIARALVNLAAEYGGESPLAVALVLCAVVALLFTSLSGLGAVIMVGSIVLPIMMTTGVPRVIASTLFLMAFALGFIFNLTNWRFYTQLFGVVPQQMTHYAVILAAIDATALVVYAVVSLARTRDYATWAVQVDEDEPPVPRVPAIALITPLLPLVLYFALHLDPTIAFIVAALFGAIVTRGTRTIETLVAAAIRGVEDVAPAILLFIGIGMLLTATKTAEFTAALAPLVQGWANNPIAYIAIFGLGSPLVLYRGPLNPFGVGIAVFTVLLATHALPPLVLVAAIMAVVQVQNVCDPTNTANVWVANFTGTPIVSISKRTLPYQVAVATLAVTIVALASPQLFGVRAFASLVAPAFAATSGFYAPAPAAQHIAIDNDGSPLASAASQSVMSALNHAPNVVFAWHGDPNASDCSAKPFAAYVLVSATTFQLIEGTDLDIGLRLEDCGGWIVDEWHDHAVEPGAPTATQAQGLALEGAARLASWAASDPRAAALFANGVAVAPNETPGYLYTVFKTVDGNMRAYVRAGGPAYDAGLRTGDVVQKLDGRFWWEYGTYQTEQRVYDGKPHTFEIQRGGRTLDISLAGNQ
jgi:H+/gluconate symporter-like permease